MADVGDLNNLGVRRKLGCNSGVDNNYKRGGRKRIINIGINSDDEVSKLAAANVESHVYTFLVQHHATFIDLIIYFLDRYVGMVKYGNNPVTLEIYVVKTMME